MTKKQKAEITRISKEFTTGMGIPINGSRWLIVDPLSAFLSVSGYENELSQIPEKDGRQQVLIMIFRDGTIFIPAGGDLKPLSKTFKNWLWLDTATLEKLKAEKESQK